MRDGVVELVLKEFDAGHEVPMAGDSAGGQIALAAGVPVVWHEVAGQLHVYALLPTKAGEQGMQAIVESLRPRNAPEWSPPFGGTV